MKMVQYTDDGGLLVVGDLEVEEYEEIDRGKFDPDTFFDMSIEEMYLYTVSMWLNITIKMVVIWQGVNTGQYIKKVKEMVPLLGEAKRLWPDEWDKTIKTYPQIETILEKYTHPKPPTNKYCQTNKVKIGHVT